VEPYDTRDEAGTLHAPEEQIGKFLSEALYEDKKYCPAGKTPRVALTQVAPIHWAKVPSKLTDGLFAADAFALLVETGTINSDWNELHDGYFMNGESVPGPAFYGIQMLHIVAHDPGDEFVATSSSSDLLAAHGVHRRHDGSLGLMLINKDRNNPVEVKVNVSGLSLAAQGTRFDYGAENFKTNGAFTKSAFSAGGGSFSVTVPAYTITDIVLTKTP
jgi:hypothetical protein